MLGSDSEDKGMVKMLAVLLEEVLRSLRLSPMGESARGDKKGPLRGVKSM